MVRLVAHAPSAEQGSDVADSVQTLAVLLQAGAVPLVAWRHLASTGDPVAVAVLARTEKGVPLVSAIGEQGGMWTELAAAWEIATTVGAPLADVLRSIAEALRDAASAADDVRVALAEPAGTARLLLWMPLAGLLLGVALGFDAWGVIVGNPLGPPASSPVCCSSSSPGSGRRLCCAARGRSRGPRGWLRSSWGGVGGRRTDRPRCRTGGRDEGGRCGRTRPCARGARSLPCGRRPRRRAPPRDRGAGPAPGTDPRSSSRCSALHAPAASARRLHTAGIPPARRGTAAAQRVRRHTAADLTTPPHR